MINGYYEDQELGVSIPFAPYRRAQRLAVDRYGSCWGRGHDILCIRLWFKWELIDIDQHNELIERAKAPTPAEEARQARRRAEWRPF